MSTTPQADRPHTGPEKDLQSACEKWLDLNGWWRRTQHNITAQQQPRHGWYAHWPQAKGNPIMLDLLLIRHDGQCLEAELKTADGKLTASQKALVDKGRGVCVRSLGEFVSVVGAWMSKK